MYTIYSVFSSFFFISAVIKSRGNAHSPVVSENDPRSKNFHLALYTLRARRNISGGNKAVRFTRAGCITIAMVVGNFDDFDRVTSLPPIVIVKSDWAGTKTCPPITSGFIGKGNSANDCNRPRSTWLLYCRYRAIAEKSPGHDSPECDCIRWSIYSAQWYFDPGTLSWIIQHAYE